MRVLNDEQSKRVSLYWDNYKLASLLDSNIPFTEKLYGILSIDNLNEFLVESHKIDILKTPYIESFYHNTDDSIKFELSNSNMPPILELCGNGDILIKGKLVDNDKDIVNALREFLSRS